MLAHVMASFEERIYELGSEALAEQERQVAEVRARGATLLAAGAVIASLLAKPVFDGPHPHGFAEIAATVVGLLGSGGVLVFVVLLLRPYELGFSVKAGATYRALWEQGILGQPMVDIALAEAFEERRNDNAVVVGRLVVFLGPDPCGGCVGDRGSCDRSCASLVSMASPRRENPPPPPPKPTSLPAPGSVPKLPQTIFNLEKRGGGGGGTRRHKSR
jgi:hypothetical protein